MGKYILSITWDCNDGDYLTENSIIKETITLEELKKVRDIFLNLCNVDSLADYDTYNYDEIKKVITDEEINYIWNILAWCNGDDEIDEDYISDILGTYLPYEWQSGQLCHSIESVQILQEIN